MGKKYVHYVKVSIDTTDGIEFDWFNVYVHDCVEAKHKVYSYLKNNTSYAKYCEIVEVSRQKPKFFTRIDNDNDNVYWVLVSFLDDKEEWYQLTANNEDEAMVKFRNWYEKNITCSSEYCIEYVLDKMPLFYKAI